MLIIFLASGAYASCIVGRCGASVCLLVRGWFVMRMASEVFRVAALDLNAIHQWS